MEGESRHLSRGYRDRWADSSGVVAGRLDTVRAGISHPRLQTVEAARRLPTRVPEAPRRFAELCQALTRHPAPLPTAENGRYRTERRVSRASAAS
jgi:hypothetical protein